LGAPPPSPQITQLYLTRGARRRYTSAVSLWRWSGGVHVVGTRIWCDAARTQGVTFVSGADVQLRRRWERLVTTERTQKLIGERYHGVLPAPFGRPFAMGRARLELLPAGRVPGSAQLRVEIDGKVALYAGAVHPSGGRLAEAAQVRGCDELVMDVAAGPPTREAEERLVAAARAASHGKEDGKPLLTAGSAWRAAELAALLVEAGLAVAATRPLAALLSRYRRLGVAVPTLTKTGGARISWPAVNDDDTRRALADVDLPALVEFAVSTGARIVHVTGGCSDEVVRAFAKKKLRVSPLGPPQQVPLFS
jgi:putative mRNA 3-end processing factor